jgi:hypothetical protein
MDTTTLWGGRFSNITITHIENNVWEVIIENQTYIAKSLFLNKRRILVFDDFNFVATDLIYDKVVGFYWNNKKYIMF